MIEGIVMFAFIFVPGIFIQYITGFSKKWHVTLCLFLLALGAWIGTSMHVLIG